MLQNENARPACPTVEGPMCEAVWATPLRSVCCIFPAVSWKDARLAPLLVWDTPNGMSCVRAEKAALLDLNDQIKGNYSSKYYANTRRPICYAATWC